MGLATVYDHVWDPYLKLTIGFFTPHYCRQGSEGNVRGTLSIRFGRTENNCLIRNKLSKLETAVKTSSRSVQRKCLYAFCQTIESNDFIIGSTDHCNFFLKRSISQYKSVLKDNPAGFILDIACHVWFCIFCGFDQANKSTLIGHHYWVHIVLPSGNASMGILKILLFTLTSSLLYSAAGRLCFLHKALRIWQGLKASLHAL